MGLKDTLQSDMKEAMKSRDTAKVSTLRMAIAEIKKREIDSKASLDDPAILKLIGSLIKQRKDSVEAFKKGNRDDLVEKEQNEINLLQKYLPEPLSEAELNQLIDSIIAETGASSPKDLGKVIPVVMAKAAGKADGKTVSQLVKSKLSSS